MTLSVRIVRSVEMTIQDLCLEADRLGEQLAVEQYPKEEKACMPCRTSWCNACSSGSYLECDRMLPRSWGRVPQGDQRIVGPFMKKKYGASDAVYLCTLMVYSFERAGFRDILSTLIGVDHGEPWYMVQGAFFQAACRKWRQLMAEREQVILERGLRHLDGLWRE